MRRRIVYTRFDGGVSVCHPSADIIAWMGCGGFWGNKPRGFVDTQIERQIARGVHPDAARRFARSMTLGGCTTAEALAIIRDRDCAHKGTGLELWDVSDIPSDRWFRNAWRRSHNGGPIDIDLKLARPIQWGRLRSAVKQEDTRRAESFDEERPLSVDWTQIRSAIRHARDEKELRRVWPAELTHG
jgi:hypothetical protein